MEAIKIPFGMADIIVDPDGENEVRFDGKEQFQHEGGELTLTPVFEDLTLGDFGGSVVDRVLTGYEGELSLTAAEQSIETLQLAIAATEEITDTEGGGTVGLMDARIGSRVREKAKKIRVHPRILGNDNSLDINIYKMAATGDFTRSFANEQGNIPVTFTLFPRDGMDANEPGNFFYVGETDPHEGTTT